MPKKYWWVLATSGYPKETPEKYPSNVLYYLEAKNGRELWQYLMKPEEPFPKVSLQYTPSISPDGKKVGILTGQGQAYLFTAAGREVWRRTISSVKDIQGIPLYAFGSKSEFQQQKLILLSSSTYNASQSALEMESSRLCQGDKGEVKLVKEFQAQTGGGFISAAMSSDGKYLAALEEPVLLADGVKVQGKYQVHLWQLK